MSEATINNLVQRMDRLERQNRRMKLAAVLMLVGIAAVIGMGQAGFGKQRIITAEQFILQDKNGNPRGGLYVRPDGSASLGITDSKEKPRFLVTVKPNGDPSLSMSGEKQELLALTPSAIGLQDREGNPRILLAEQLNGGASLNIYQKNGQRIALTSSGLVSRDRKDTIRYATITLPNGTTRLKISGENNQTMELWHDSITFKKDDKIRATLWLQDNGDPVLKFVDNYGKSRLNLLLEKGTPIIGIFNESEKLTWTAP